MIRCPKCGNTEIYLIYFHGYPELICKCGYKKEISNEEKLAWELETLEGVLIKK